MAANIKLPNALTLLSEIKSDRPSSTKAQLEAAFAMKTGLTKTGSVYAGSGYAIRYAEANKRSFSNVVLALSKLEPYDSEPMVICIVRPGSLDFRLANTTFLKKISHSSHKFRTDNIRGSFLGNDIMDEYAGLPNRRAHFDALMAIHSAFTWVENVERLVEATNAIVPRATRFVPVGDDLSLILDAPARASAASNLPRFAEVERELNATVQRCRSELLNAAELDNVNLRGNRIEQLITGKPSAHRLDDITYELTCGCKLIVDIKTKLLDRASAPKAYNIDKMLCTLARSGSIFSFYFIGINMSEGTIIGRLVSIFDPIVVSATLIQLHWAGRGSRGVTQLTRNLDALFAPTYRPSIDEPGALALLNRLVEL